MSSVNKVILIGNLGADPDVKFTAGGKAVTEFRLATSEKWGDEERVEWHRIVTWEKQAEFCGKYLKKGDKVYLEGRIQTRSYDDKDGNKKYLTEIVAFSVQSLTPKAKDAAPAPAESAPRQRQATKKVKADDTDLDALFAQ